MKFLMNFTTSDDDIRRYSSARDLREYYQRYGLSGLEVMPLSYQDGDMWRQPGQCSVIEPDMVTGVHACCISDWMGLDRTFYAYRSRACIPGRGAFFTECHAG